jgi:cytochrome c556
MRKLALLVSASMALAACSSGGDDAAEPAAPASTAGSEAPAEAEELATMPTDALSGEAAATAMHNRHEWFEEMGDSFKLLARQSKADAPDMAVVKEASAVIAGKAPKLPGLFAPGTGPDVGKTEAKANIWETPDDFMAKAKDFHAAAIALNTVAMSGDAAGFKEAFAKTGGTCKACHDTYREED